MLVQITGADLFEALQNYDGEDVWYLVDEHFSNLGKPNPYECPITGEMPIETNDFKEIVANAAKVKKVAQLNASSDTPNSANTEETHIVKPEDTELLQSEYGMAIQQIVGASAEHIHSYLAENAYALGTTATEIYASVLEQTIVSGVGNATNSVLNRLADSLDQVSKDGSQDFLEKYNLGQRAEVETTYNPATTQLLKKRFQQFKTIKNVTTNI
jgi:hypothetical protein